jgi:broad specificity phosphatase PhoE
MGLPEVPDAWFTPDGERIARCGFFFSSVMASQSGTRAECWKAKPTSRSVTLAGHRRWLWPQSSRGFSRIAPSRQNSCEPATLLRCGYPQARYEPGLHETEVGASQGQSISDLVAADADACAGWRAGTHRPDGGVVWDEFTARASAAILAELAKGRAQTRLAVCHGGVIRALLQRFLNLAPRQIIPAAPPASLRFEWTRTAVMPGWSYSTTSPGRWTSIRWTDRHRLMPHGNHENAKDTAGQVNAAWQ